MRRFSTRFKDCFLPMMMEKELPMNRKSIFALILILLLAAVSILGLPIMTHKTEQKAESLTPTVTATPQPNEDFIEAL